jgi:hypothetical protein
MSAEQQQVGLEEAWFRCFLQTINDAYSGCLVPSVPFGSRMLDELVWSK